MSERRQQLISVFVGSATALGAGWVIYNLIQWDRTRKAALKNIYESQKSLNEYLMMHFGNPRELVQAIQTNNDNSRTTRQLSRDGSNRTSRDSASPKRSGGRPVDFPAGSSASSAVLEPVNARPSGDALSFPAQCAQVCIDIAKSASGIPLRALDVGCAVGRSSFELTRYFDEVIGIDFSASFITAAKKIKDEGKMEYTIVEEGEITSQHVAEIDISIVTLFWA